MKRDLFSKRSPAEKPAGQRFPTVTLMFSVGLLVGGMRLADVLPVPHLPRFPAASAPERGSDISAPAPGYRSYAASQAGISGAAAETAALFQAAPPGPHPAFAPSAAAPSAGAPSPDAEAYRGYPARGYGMTRIMLSDVSFLPIQVPIWSMASRLAVRAQRDALALVDSRSGAVVWTGSPDAAHFTFSSVSGAQTLRDARGAVLWSETPAPDLLFDKRPDGTARLSDRNGATLWKGALGPSPATAVSRGDRRGTAYTLDFAGVRVSGANGAFTLIDGTGDQTRVLWSGTLPLEPVLLFRDDHKFFFWGRDHSEGSSDRVTDIRLVPEAGRVAVADVRQQVLGEQPVLLLKAESAVHILGENKMVRVPRQYCVPQGNLAKSGVVLFSYKDGTGSVVRRNSLVRDGGFQRTNNSGSLY